MFPSSLVYSEKERSLQVYLPVVCFRKLIITIIGGDEKSLIRADRNLDHRTDFTINFSGEVISSSIIVSMTGHKGLLKAGGSTFSALRAFQILLQ